VTEGAETSIMHQSHHPLQRISKGFKKYITHFFAAKTLMDLEFEALKTPVTQPPAFHAVFSKL
jgi:hypothetical protein